MVLCQCVQHPLRLPLPAWKATKPLHSGLEGLEVCGDFKEVGDLGVGSPEELRGLGVGRVWELRYLSGEGRRL